MIARFCNLGWGLLLAVFILLAGKCYGAEHVTIYSPQDKHFAGQPLYFHIQANDFFSPESATVFYRNIGVSVYQQLPMEKETAVTFTASLKGQKVLPPGIEYFLVVKDGRDRTFTFPAQDPKKNPYTLPISLDESPPKITEIAPGEGTRIFDRQPKIKISYLDPETRVDVSSIRLYLDNTDITQLAEITDQYVLFQPLEELEFGSHAIVIEMMDINGNYMQPKVITFITPKSEWFDTGSANLQWDTEAQKQLASHEDNEEPDWNLQSSANLSSLVERGDVRGSLDANVWYIEEEGPGPEGDKFTLSNFLAEVQKQENRLAYGDLNIEGTELISQSISRRGGLAEVNVAETRAEAFVVRSNYSTDFDHSLDAGDPDQRLAGGGVERDMLSEGKLHVKGMYVYGRNQNPESYNVGTTEGGTEGNIFSVSFLSRLFQNKFNLEGEYSGSNFDDDITDEEEDSWDKAWRARTFGQGSMYDWSAGYKYLGPEFQSVVEPAGANDREEYMLDGGVTLTSSSIRANVVHSRDNVDEDSSVPVTRNTTTTLNYNLNKENWPAMYLSFTADVQRSEKEPSGYSHIDYHTHTIGGGLTYSKPRWSLSPNYTFTNFDDQSEDSDFDSKIHVLSLSGSWQPIDTLSINPSLSYTNYYFEASEETTDTWQGSLGSTYAFTEYQNLNLTLSYFDNRTHDGVSSHTTTWNVVGQYNWSIEQYLFDYGKQTLSLRGQYNTTEDRINETLQEDYSIYGIISIGLPVTLY